MKSIFSLVPFALAALGVVSGAAVDLGNSTEALEARALEARALAKGPHFAVYADQFLSKIPSTTQLKGWNTLNLAFLLTSGPADNAVVWSQMSASERKSVKASLNKAGIKVMVSAFGSTEQPTTAGKNPTSTAKTLAAWVKKYGLDGIDIDYEDLTSFDNGTGGEQWLIQLTKTLRDELPSPQYIITHAPVAPWFATGGRWRGGRYLAVNKAVGSLIDWYNVQFYNQGASAYTSCETIFTKSGGAWPETSVFEMNKNGVPLSKIVVGKPAGPSDATNGYVAPASLGKCVKAAVAKGWKGGVMSWEYPRADAAWIKAARAGAI
jgi:chitinase